MLTRATNDGPDLPTTPGDCREPQVARVRHHQPPLAAGVELGRIIVFLSAKSKCSTSMPPRKHLSPITFPPTPSPSSAPDPSTRTDPNSGRNSGPEARSEPVGAAPAACGRPEAPRAPR